MNRKALSRIIIMALLVVLAIGVVHVLAANESDPQYYSNNETGTDEQTDDTAAETSDPDTLVPPWQTADIKGAVYPKVINNRDSAPVEVKVYLSGEVAWSDPDGVNEKRDLYLCSVIADEEGIFHITVPADREYDILFDRPGYLDYVITGVRFVPDSGGMVEDIELEEFVGEINMIPGDIASVGSANILIGIKDGVVDDNDLLALNNYFRKPLIPNEQNILAAICDFDDNGKVDAIDFGLLMMYRGRTAVITSFVHVL